MLWLRQTPFLAVIVFGVGIGLGLAWKTGWIPVELSEANTGSLPDSDAVAADVAPADDGIMPTASAPIPQDFLSSNEPEVLVQSEPDAEEALTARLQPTARPLPLDDRLTIRLPTEVDRVSPAVRRNSDEPEWATTTANQAGQVQAQSRAAINNTPTGTAAIGRAPINNGPTGNAAKGNAATGSPARRAGEIRLAAGQVPDREFGLPSAEPPGTSPVADDLMAIDEQIANADYLGAHRALSKLYWNHREARPELLKRLQQTSRVIFFEPQPHFVEPYVIQPNDRLSAIASKYQLSWEYVAKLNRTEPRRIQQGQKLKILKGPFAAVVDLGEFALTVHLQGYFVKRYDVGIGKDGASPVGKFTVQNKVENPQYTGPDGKVIPADNPSNPLGERWIDLGESYGIHGTIDPDSVGKAASRGCIRMREKDVIEVYDFLVKGSEVTIRK